MCVRASRLEKKVHRQGEKQLREEQRSRSTGKPGWAMSVSAPFTNRQGSAENTTDLCPDGLFSGGSSLLGPVALTLLWAAGQLQ